jgi:hypothetical protein
MLADCCECGDELSSSGATELVKSNLKQTVSRYERGSLLGSRRKVFL